VIPASAVDLSFVSSFVARKALDILEGNDIENNHLLWSREIAIDVDPRLDRRHTVVESHFKARADCTACQEPDVGDVVISDEVREVIRSEVESSLDVETGGILIGYVQERKAIVVKATGPGPKAKRTPRTFERDVEFVQQQLDQAAAELGAQGQYIGEWHSHLERDPEPSGRDIMSLCGIAAAPNYATRCPVMIIAGIDSEAKKLSGLKAWSFPLTGRVYTANLMVEPSHA